MNVFWQIMLTFAPCGGESIVNMTNQHYYGNINKKTNRSQKAAAEAAD